jgi:hypothetical protein
VRAAVLGDDSDAGVATGARAIAGALGLVGNGAAAEALAAGAAGRGVVEPVVDGLRSATGPRGPVVFCASGLALRAAASSRSFALACAAAASLSRAAVITGGDDVARPELRAGAADGAAGF